jgi:hypothetical protein
MPRWSTMITRSRSVAAWFTGCHGGRGGRQRLGDAIDLSLQLDRSGDQRVQLALLVGRQRAEHVVGRRSRTGLTMRLGGFDSISEAPAHRGLSWPRGEVSAIVETVPSPHVRSFGARCHKG